MAGKERGIPLKQIFTGEESLVNKRIIVKELSSLGTVIEDGSNCTNPYLTVRLDHASQFEKSSN